MKREIVLPKIEKGIPIPQLRLKDSRNRPLDRPRSPWPAFLKGLEMWDSFVIAWPEINSVYQWSRKLGIHLVKFELLEKSADNRPQARVWLVPDDYGFTKPTPDSGDAPNAAGDAR